MQYLRIPIVALSLILFISAQADSQQFSGKLIVEMNSTVSELEIASDGTQSKLVPITEKHAIFVSISPDKSRLAYYSNPNKQIRLYDFRTKHTKTIANVDTGCLSWSPDGRRFSVEARDKHQLYVYDLQGNKTLILEAPSAEYSPHGIGKGQKEYAYLDCGMWISADRFVFQRVIRMPHKLEDMRYDTTTVAILANKPTLVNLSERVFIMDVCEETSAILFSDQHGVVKLVHNFQDLNTPNARSIGIKLNDPNYSRGIVGFVPDSNCQIYHVDPSLGLEKGKIYFINPENMQKQLIYVHTRAMPITSWDGTWLGSDKNQKVIVISESDLRVDDPEYFFAINLNTSEKIKLGQTPEHSGLHGWIP